MARGQRVLTFSWQLVAAKLGRWRWHLLAPPFFYRRTDFQFTLTGDFTVTVISELREREKKVGYEAAFNELMGTLIESMAQDSETFRKFFEQMTTHQRDCMQITLFRVATKPESQSHYARAVAKELSDEQLKVVFALAAFGIKQLEVAELAEDGLEHKAREDRERAEQN